jgi:hypothetical protein
VIDQERSLKIELKEGRFSIARQARFLSPGRPARNACGNQNPLCAIVSQ